MFVLNPTNDAFTHPANAIYVLPTNRTSLPLVNASPDYKSRPEWFA